ncbi:MAG: DUF6273 domain-containing protein [Eubacteriales bacterium]|nr:DUF6273 domain-containing protein [Eubacteriales bacterium]
MKRLFRKHEKSNKLFRKLVASALCLAMALSLVNVQIAAASNAPVKNPKQVYSEKTGLKSTYSVIYFGSYPQAEVVPSVDKETTVSKIRRNRGNDYIVDAKIYRALTSCKKWDANGDAVIDGVQYRRVKYTDATYYNDKIYYTDNYYNWGGSGFVDQGGELKNTYEHIDDSYHYFMYQPIKWRVLQVEGDNALLLSDVCLECKAYNDGMSDSDWKNATIRSFLNSYKASYNKEKKNYAANGFYNTAFSTQEKKSIVASKLGYDYGQVKDKIYLISDSEAKMKDYGFCYDCLGEDPARCVNSSTYAKAMGIGNSSNMTQYADQNQWYLGNAYYGEYDNRGVPYVKVAGWYNDWEGQSGTGTDGIRPALRLKLSSSVYTIGTPIVSTKRLNSVSTQTITFKLKSATVKAAQLKSKGVRFNLKAKSKEGGKLTYKVIGTPKNAKKYISVSTKGVVTLKKGAPKGKYWICITAAKKGKYEMTKKMIVFTIK